MAGGTTLETAVALGARATTAEAAASTATAIKPAGKARRRATTAAASAASTAAIAPAASAAATRPLGGAVTRPVARLVADEAVTAPTTAAASSTATASATRIGWDTADIGAVARPVPWLVTLEAHIGASGSPRAAPHAAAWAAATCSWRLIHPLEKIAAGGIIPLLGAGIELAAWVLCRVAGLDRRIYLAHALYKAKAALPAVARGADAILSCTAIGAAASTCPIACTGQRGAAVGVLA